MLLSLFAVKTINLTEIALAFGGEAKVSSRYRRLQRFCGLFQIDFLQIAAGFLALRLDRSRSVIS
ncbi:hypothetical protein FIV31_07950 [Coxiella endosymbiont of Ornithodoros amblus]|nr:hypothetical protein [Coxiella endosymbiont of Ornithodoros amblus]